jgi:hypothetical protein
MQEIDGSCMNARVSLSSWKAWQAGQFYQRGLRVMFKASLLGLGGSLALRAR